MARTTVKSTYSLDVQTVKALEELARRWKVPKSEALRRAIRAASKGAATESTEAVQALDELQRSLGLTRASARGWERNSSAERRASSKRLEGNSR